MAEKVTLSLAEATLARARESAQAEGINLSAWMDRAARQHAQRDAGRRYAAWLSEHPEIEQEVAGWRAVRAEATAKRWAGLGEAA